MKIRKLLATPMVAMGVLGAAAVPFSVAEVVTSISAAPAHADGCGGGGVPLWAGGGGCRYTSPSGDTVDCGGGHGGPWGGGGCHIWGGPLGDIWCSGSYHGLFLQVWNVNPCPYVP
jgi:hypothetical protein